MKVSEWLPALIVVLLSCLLGWELAQVIMIYQTPELILKK